MMKSFKINQLKYLAFLFVLALFSLTACKKEKPLEPDPTIEPKQTPDDAGNGNLANGVDKTNSTTFQYNQNESEKVQKEKKNESNQ